MIPKMMRPVLSPMTMTTSTPELREIGKSSRPWVIVIDGPTAVGKTDVAIALAQALDTKILSADSRQCYQELNIGTAKPSQEQLATVAHGFINTHSIHNPVSAADFEQEGLDFLEDVFSHRNVALVVGGSGLYLKALLQGLDPVPQPDLQIRQNLQAQLDQHGKKALANRLAKLDPEAYEAIDTANPARILRALEVYYTTGYSITNYWQKSGTGQRNFRVLRITLSLPRSSLHERINHRCDKMLEKGLLQEVRNLYPFRHYSVLQTVGYQEFFEYIDGYTSFEEALRQFKAHTRQFAKRQITWFRRNEGSHWFEPHQFSAIAKAINDKTGYLSTFAAGHPLYS